MNTDSKAYQIVQKMLEKDAFSEWLGIRLLDIKEGYCELEMVVRTEMLNGFSIAHGGITFSFADSAFAFASNSYGQKAVSIHTAINHLLPVFPNDRLQATAEVKFQGNRTGVFKVDIINQKNELVAVFSGTVYRKKDVWEV